MESKVEGAYFQGNDMPIPESTLSKWSHHQAGTAFKQTHVPIREALGAYKGLSQFKYEVFLQGSYKNDTNLGGDSDVEVVIRLASKLKPRVVTPTALRYAPPPLTPHRRIHKGRTGNSTIAEK